eukprot:scaffold82340_cov48-Phaeocystis_antarctica.AAC.3
MVREGLPRGAQALPSLPDRHLRGGCQRGCGARAHREASQGDRPLRARAPHPGKARVRARVGVRVGVSVLRRPAQMT